MNEKLLGVEFDQSLNWPLHTDSMCKKISQRLGTLQRTRHFLPLNARLSFYRWLILSVMDYCGVVWGNTSQQNLDRFLKLQKRAATLILDADKRAPSLSLFLKLRWLPIQDRIKYFRCLLVHKSLHGLAPSYVSDLMLPFSHVHNRYTRSAVNNSLKLPKVNNNSGKRTFAFMAATDSLDIELRSSSSLPQFRRAYLKMAFTKLAQLLLKV